MLTFETIEKRLKKHKKQLAEQTLDRKFKETYLCYDVRDCLECEMYKKLEGKSVYYCTEMLIKIIRKRKLSKLLSHP